MAKGIEFRDFICLSVHLAFRSEAQLVQEVSELADQVRSLRRGSQKPCIVAGDFNVGFGCSLPGALGPFSGSASHFARYFLDFVLAHSVVVINSFYDHPASHVACNPHAGSTDIDWVMISSSMPFQTTECVYHDANDYIKTDHYSITWH